MQVRRVTTDGGTAQLTSDELLVINNALNEVCNGITIADFQSRLGVNRDDAVALLDAVGQLLDRIDRTAEMLAHEPPTIVDQVDPSLWWRRSAIEESLAQQSAESAVLLLHEYFMVDARLLVAHWSGTTPSTDHQLLAMIEQYRLLTKRNLLVAAYLVSLRDRASHRDIGVTSRDVSKLLSDTIRVLVALAIRVGVQPDQIQLLHPQS